MVMFNLVLWREFFNNATYLRSLQNREFLDQMETSCPRRFYTVKYINYEESQSIY